MTFDIPPQVKNITLHIILPVFVKHLKNSNNNDYRKPRENLTVRYRYAFNVRCVFCNFLGSGLADVYVSFVFRAGKDTQSEDRVIDHWAAMREMKKKYELM